MNRYLLNASINAEKDMLARCRNALKGLPRGGLTSYLRNGRLYYKRNEAGEQKYLGTESNPMVNKLKKRHLLEQMIDILENNIPLLENLKNKYQEYDPAYLQKQFSRAYKDVPEEVYRELGYVREFKERTFRDDSRIYKTSSGLLLRSRIEALIASLYEDKGITFHYEAPLIFSDGSTLHPDFTVYCSSCNKYRYHEHIGLLSNGNYLKSFLWKVEHYINHGLYPFYDVLFTFEKPDSGIDMNEISCLIDLFMQ